MSTQDLADELTNDPAGINYSTMSDKEAADAIDNENGNNGQTVIKQSVSGDGVFQQTDPTEFANLSNNKQQQWISWTSKDNIDPEASNNIEFVRFIFGSGSTTESNLGTFRQETISRADQLRRNGKDIPSPVRTKDVEEARAL